jgi:hypothetical protein
MYVDNYNFGVVAVNSEVVGLAPVFLIWAQAYVNL